ncbi:Ppx/GppA family phosphatase [Belnapia rosea]|uniref:Exopolyphosphatase / guanosine-5'-triphosphate,3'-diphosphate pyrophosphatase n=1 Tax=Belnapia rosea TaxID=938405 RepID=A0A1G6Y1Q9_9PROT|nr:Ppx/GppA family phosphatase [Belnapia rosea]SDB72799.1 exopolyphosphatase / guanosine-5'-triphosphate,3'-diphosphate pyrophosphatase [Belnapia rosea]SDD83863.1 exopolyphosphatase / guanosine-5'-triphosphate,3'-diphosphate pyrophosphatase [Belnapia rosea]
MPTPESQRCGVVDLGSNSVRLVVFEGRGRNPQAIFNEKAVLGLGRGLQTTGRLNEDAIGPALTVLARYHAVARAMHADPLEVVATAAVRDAENGPAFVAAMQERMPGLRIRILTGEEEGRLSADGVLLGFPGADGVLGDLGGGSLEVVRLTEGRVARAASLPIGAIRLAERAGGEVARARAITEEELAKQPWLAEGGGRDLYLVGGAWRALARMHIAQTGYPLAIVHHYVLRREEARDLAGVVMAASRRVLERMAGAPQKRLADMPFAAVTMRRLLRATGASRVVFSANGLREGWYARLLAESVRQDDPMLAAARELAAAWGRDPGLPPALIAWTDPVFPEQDAGIRALREAACWISDIGSHDHPEYRAEQAFLRVLRQHGAGLDHHARAFLGLCAALRYEAEPSAPFLGPTRVLLDLQTIRRAEALGAALRLAYTLCGGTPDLLAGTRLERTSGRLVLRLAEGTGVFAGESVLRRVEQLGAVLGLEALVEVEG